MRTNLWVGAGALVALTAVTGCSVQTEDRACTAVGGVSGVTVQLKGVPDTVYRLCAASECQTRTFAKGSEESPFGLFVELPDKVAAIKMPVRLTVTPKGAARPSADVHATVTMKRWYPNGKGCGPTVYLAALDYDPVKGLVVSNRTTP